VGLKNNSGLTLFELLISIAILGILMVGLHQALGTAISAYGNTKNKQELLAQARYTMERMVMFVNETDYIWKPDDVDQEILRVGERVLDTYNNATHAYDIDGDGYLDADNDYNGTINVTLPPDEQLTFSLDKTEASNWKLKEEMPDYSTADYYDTSAGKVICEHITAFNCSRLSANLVEIELTLNNGKSEVSLKTRARARLIE